MTTTKDRIRVMVYGSLKQGFGNHDWFLAGNAEVKFLGRCYTLGDYDMYDNGAFPIVTHGPDERRQVPIVGEVYEIDPNTLDALDCLEGHPDWYHRVKVDTPWKKAWMYVMPASDRFPEDARVSSGCWRMTKEEKEWIDGSEIAA